MVYLICKLVMPLRWQPPRRRLTLTGTTGTMYCIGCQTQPLSLSLAQPIPLSITQPDYLSLVRIHTKEGKKEWQQRFFTEHKDSQITESKIIVMCANFTSNKLMNSNIFLCLCLNRYDAKTWFILLKL